MKKRKLLLRILMAGKYDFQPGKKIHVHKLGKFYYASSNQMDFGLVKEVENGTEDDMKYLKSHFNGLVKFVNAEEHSMEILVKVGKRKKKSA